MLWHIDGKYIMFDTMSLPPIQLKAIAPKVPVTVRPVRETAAELQGKF